MFKMYRISKIEECPCGSNKIYKECCYNKEAIKFKNEKHAMSIISKNSKKSRVNLCLVNGCKSKAIGAHALQENGLLSKLAINNIVLTQNKKKDATLIEFENGEKEARCFLTEELIKNATVQTCFCKKHDNELFQEIEKSNKTFSIDNSEQVFLFAYRTFSFEYYSEIISNNFYEKMFKDVPQLLKKPICIANYRQSQIKKQEMDYYKNKFDEIMLNKSYSDVITLTITFPYKIRFANYMCVAPEFDLTGRKLNVIDKKTKMMRRLFITLFPKENKSYILISVLKEDFNIYKDYFKSFENVSSEVIKYYFNTIIPAISENLILSPELWNELDEIGQELIQVAVSEPNPKVLLIGLRNMLKKINRRCDFVFQNVKYNLFDDERFNINLKLINGNSK